MENLQQIDFIKKPVCLTAYKTFLLLKFLLRSPLEISKIIELFEKDPFIEDPLSIPNLRYLVKSLREIGCKIHKPILINNKKYILGENPFLITLDEDEIKLICKFKKNPYEKNDWKTILYTNSFINKICLIFNNKKDIHKLKNTDLLSTIDPKLIFDIEEFCKKRSTVVFKYHSGIRLCNMELVVSFLKYEKDKLYVWGYNPHFDDFSYLRVDKIRSYKVYKEYSPKILNGKVVRYKMFNKNYILNDNEVLIEDQPDGLIIDYKIGNNFHAIQKFLELGPNCKILSPESFKEDFLETLKLTKMRYSDAG